jgi:hypothetical protein
MLPTVFDSVEQARQYWDLIVEADMLWRVSHASGISTLDVGEKNIRESLGKPSAFSHKIHQELHSYTTLKEGWFRSFQPVFERSRAQKGTKEFLGAGILMIKYLSSRFALPRLHDSDTSVDGFLSDYVTVVNLARDLLEAELTKGVNEKPIFIFDGNRRRALPRCGPTAAPPRSRSLVDA